MKLTRMRESWVALFTRVTRLFENIDVHANLYATTIIKDSIDGVDKLEERYGKNIPNWTGERNVSRPEVGWDLKTDGNRSRQKND